MGSTRATSRGNHRSKVRACDSLCGTFCSYDFTQVGPICLMYWCKFGVYPLWCKVYVHRIHCVYGHSGVDSKDKLYTF